MKEFSIANLSESDKASLSELEAQFKTETGKDCVLIAWEKNSN